MKYQVTEYARINLDSEQWECRVCDHVLGNARENYKKFTKIYNRNPREIHRPQLDPDKYEYDFAPDPKLCVIYEFYCPNCGTMMDVEYTVPGHMPAHDIELDVDVLKEKMKGQVEISEPGVGLDITQSVRDGAHDHADHSHDH